MFGADCDHDCGMVRIAEFSSPRCPCTNLVLSNRQSDDREERNWFTMGVRILESVLEKFGHVIVQIWQCGHHHLLVTFVAHPIFPMFSIPRWRCT